MSHKTLVNGTVYEVGGGKTLIDGVAYSIDKGKTLVGGTAYEVGFAPPVATVTITTGWFDNSTITYGYVSIDGVQYAQGTTLEVPIGTEIYCYVSYSPRKEEPASFIKLNGTTVATGVQISAGSGYAEYYYAVTGDVKIQFLSFDGMDANRIIITEL